MIIGVISRHSYDHDLIGGHIDELQDTIWPDELSTPWYSPCSESDHAVYDEDLEHCIPTIKIPLEVTHKIKMILFGFVRRHVHRNFNFNFSISSSISL